jgi:hypothetical protein
MRALQYDAQAEAGGLLRVLFLRLNALSSTTGIGRDILLRSLTPCCSADSADWHPLNRRQRTARFIVGAGLLWLDVLLSSSHALSITVTAAAAFIGWFGVTHVVAALIAYPGCPELGAVPTLLLRRDIKIGCGPWRWLDERLRLVAE